MLSVAVDMLDMHKSTRPWHVVQAKQQALTVNLFFTHLHVFLQP